MSQTLDLVLGQKLGEILTLGDSLHNVLSLFRVAREQWPHADIAWDDTAPSSAPLLVTLQTPPLRLLFDAETQLLCLIELSEPGKWATYRGKPIAVDDGRATRKGLQRIFGPAEAPKPHPSHAEEMLVAYPGAAFGIDKADQVTRLVVTSISSAAKENVYATALSQPPLRLARQIELVDVQLGSPTRLRLTFSAASQREPVECVLGQTTAEDLRIDLGPPSRLFNREDDRMAIHSASSDSQPAYFATHFDLGIDCMLDSVSHTLLKVVLHSNIPGEALFGRYARCPWRIEHAGRTLCFTNQSVALLAGLDRPISKANGKTPSPQPREAPLVLDRSADAFEGLAHGKTTEIHGFPGVALELTTSGECETLWLF